MPVAAPVLLEGEPVSERHKTYTMPWKTCSVCPYYPFPSVLLLDPLALWQLSLIISHTTASHASPLQHPQSPSSDIIYQNQRNPPNDPLPEISRAQPIPSINREHSKHIRNILRGRDTIILCYVSLLSQHHSCPHLSKAQALAWQTLTLIFLVQKTSLKKTPCHQKRPLHWEGTISCLLYQKGSIRTLNGLYIDTF